MAKPAVPARDAKGKTVIVTMPGEQPAAVKVTTSKDSGRQFVILGFKHPTCGTVHKEYPKNYYLDQA